MTFLKKTTNRRVGSFFAVAALVLATITPGLVPAFASAAQVTERSITLSNSSKEMTGVEYTVEFTPVAGAKAVVVDFCSDSPLIGTACDAPDGFTVAAAATAGGFTRTTAGSNDANTAIYTGTITAATPVSLTINNVTNPDEAGALYARIVTYDGADTTAAETAAKAYTSTAIGSGAVDQGSAALSITDSIGVSGAVLETMTFCVSGIQIKEDGCTTTGPDNITPTPLTAPTLKLGEDNAGVIALDATHLSQGSVYTQISTNASSGAVVKLKSGNDCGGLKRASVATCDIAAAMASPAAIGDPLLGVTVNPTNGTLDADGALQIAGAFYSASIFKLNYTSGGASGVTSPFGDDVLNTNSLPASNKNATVTFGASVNAQTPAGLYSNDYSLIATGKY